MLKSLFFALVTILFAQCAMAETNTKLQNSLNKNGVRDISQINKSPIAGLYEVVTSDHIYYADENGEYLIDGSLFDLKARRNLTDARARQLFAVDFNKLPLELAVKIVKGNGSRKLAFFSDPNCGWCKKLEHELQSVNNVTMYVFISTHIGGRDSEEKARAVWCSKDRAKAWDDLMIDGATLPAGNCAAPTAKVMELAKKMKVNGTPALIFANGEINPGYMPAADLEKALDAKK
ncbi:MAG: DsbC family protein [Gallionellaceae bacterium]|nr:DsbC family protein [Gallionellaceae bacterium]